MSEYLFVYGTLRKNYDLKLKKMVSNRMEYLGQGKVGASLYDIGRYPGAIKSNRGDEVIGDVFLVTDSDKVLKLFDRYEGISEEGKHDADFIRKKTRVRLRSGKTLLAWVYWYNQSVVHKRKIKHKSYLAYIKSKAKN